MKLTIIEAIRVDIPFTDGGKGEGLTPSRWNNLEMLLVRVETDTGLIGWGECFGYFCADAVKAFLQRSVFPILHGTEIDDPAAVSLDLQKRLALFGRYGLSIFALSGVDIALWDLKGKAAGKSIAALICDDPRSKVQAYASLVRYGAPEVAADFTARAVREGFEHIKLHEVTRPDIQACYDVRGSAEMMVDVNCFWSEEQAKEMAAWLKGLDTKWLEEPTFPPEDNRQYAALRDAVPDLALSGGENLCTAWQFEPLIASGAVSYPQPSVTKVGGISEFLKVMSAAKAAGLTVMPHSPYFGPGYLATLQLSAALGADSLFEYLYIWPEASLFANLPHPVQSWIDIPNGPGLGMDPDPTVLAKYRVS